MKEHPDSLPAMHGNVTNPQRFAPLYEMADEIMNQLQLTFDLQLRRGLGIDADLEMCCQLARPTVAVEPSDARAAPIVFVFSTFPGLLMRLGKWYTTAFPICGCDACAETAASEATRLQMRIADVTEGRFRELMRLVDTETAELESEFWSIEGRIIEKTRTTVARSQEMSEDMSGYRHVWKPWPRRR